MATSQKTGVYVVRHLGADLGRVPMFVSKVEKKTDVQVSAPEFRRRQAEHREYGTVSAKVNAL